MTVQRNSKTPTRIFFMRSESRGGPTLKPSKLVEQVEQRTERATKHQGNCNCQKQGVLFYPQQLPHTS